MKLNYNSIVLAIAKYPNTFKRCREYFLKLLNNNVEQLTKIETTETKYIIFNYVAFIESCNIHFIEALCYFGITYTSSNFLELLTTTVIGCFHKLETNDLDFNPY